MDRWIFLVAVCVFMERPQTSEERRPTTDFTLRIIPNCPVKHYTQNSTLTYQDCFEGKCFCSETIANCSRNFGNLTGIPKLHERIILLNLSYNSWEIISENTFQNVTQVEVLDLSHNNITVFHKRTFHSLKRLKILLMTHNEFLGTTALDIIFSTQSLECVDLQSGNIESVPQAPQGVSLFLELKTLILHDNDINPVRLDVLAQIAHFVNLSFGLNSVHKIVSAEMPFLFHLDLSRNSLDAFPETCSSPGNASFFPRLHKLGLRKNGLDSLPARICLPSLTLLDIGGNYFPEFYKDMFSPALFPSLKRLYLEFVDTQVEVIHGYAFSNPTVEQISLIFNHIDFSLESRISKDSFAGCPKLQYLKLSNNAFDRVSEGKFVSLIGNITTLEVIILDQTGFQELTKQTFAKLHNLKKLDLSNNKLTKIPDGAFDNNKKLEILQLQRNRISRITESTFSEQLRLNFRNNETKFAALDISDNSFVCDCQLRWFSAWLRSNATALRNPRLSYDCGNINLTLQSFIVRDQKCLLSEAQAIDLIVSMCFLVFLIAGFSLLFRYKWQIRLRLYEVFRGPADARRRLLLEKQFYYDVFVSYSSLDKKWVFEYLIPELEGRLRLRLCIHDRDFVPGRPVVDNIIQCLERSRKIVMVFSKDFLSSSWCQFELAVCLHHVLDCEDSLIAVCLGDVASRQMTSAMTAVTKTMTYIQWKEGSEKSRRKRSEFRDKLRVALEEILPDPFDA